MTNNKIITLEPSDPGYPWIFRAMGKDAQKIFKGLMQGQAKLARTSHDTIAFTEKTYKPEEAKNWERKLGEMAKRLCRLLTYFLLRTLFKHCL